MSTAFLISLVLVSCVTTPDLRGGDPETSPEAEGYNHYIAGIMLDKDGKAEAALEEFQKASDMLPESSELNWRLLNSYIEANDLAKAEKACNRLLKSEGDNVRLWIMMGMIQQELGNQEASAEAFEKALALNPQRLVEYEWLVEAGEKARDWVTTIEVLEKLVELAPDKAEWQAALGIHLSRINDGEGARKAFEKALQVNPALDDARKQLGLVYMQLDQDQSAVDTLSTFLQKVPDDARAREFLAGALCRTGKYGPAKDELAKLDETRKEDAPLNLEYIYTLLRAGDARTAADLQAPEGTPILSSLFNAIARKAAGDPYKPLLDALDAVQGELDVECGDALNSMLYLFGKKDTGEFLITTLEGLRAEGVQSMNLDIVLARLYMMLAKFSEAEGILVKVAEAHPDEKYPHLYLSTVYDELDRFRDAEKQLKRCLEINPADSEAMNNLAYLYAERDMRLDEAEKLLKRALEVEPNNGYYLDSLGWVYYRRGEQDKAIEYIRRAIVSMDHDDAILRDHLGDAYMLKGNAQRAVAEWKRARRLDPKLEGVQEKIDKHAPKEPKGKVS